MERARARRRTGARWPTRSGRPGRKASAETESTAHKSYEYEYKFIPYSYLLVTYSYTFDENALPYVCNIMSYLMTSDDVLYTRTLAKYEAY